MNDVQSAKTIRSLVIRLKQRTVTYLAYLASKSATVSSLIIQSLLMLSERAMQLCQA